MTHAAGAHVAETAHPLDRPSAFPASFLGPVRWSLYLSLFALAVGGLIGLFQAFERFGWDIYPSIPIVSNYYQGLTVHGVYLALVFTFAFSNGFLSLTTARGLGRPLASEELHQGAFWCLLIGVVMASVPVLANEASVLFTFYPPLKAHPAFYLGAALVVISTWLVFFNQALSLRAWMREHPGERVPLLAFTSVITYLLWLIASVGVAVEVLVLLLPWSMGWTELTDPQLARTLFWFSGHAIVYIWLLPVYVSWYVLFPKQVGGRVYSDPVTRFVFLLFLLYSTPIGIHHQFTESALGMVQKAIQGALTFAVFFPSMITAFSVMAVLEVSGRARGGTGLLGWIPRLPWGDPSVTAQLLAMLGFMMGGVSGLINASYTVNLVVHNTAFIPGHFHLTVGTAVALSIMGITYWLLPYLTERALWGRQMALAQAWLWIIGVLIFSRGQVAGGLTGMPRRTAIGLAPYTELFPTWTLDNALTAIGGIIMVISGLLYFVVILGTLLGAGGRAEVEMPVAEGDGRTERVWPVLDNWRGWLVATLALLVFSYTPVFAQLLPPNISSPGFRVW